MIESGVFVGITGRATGEEGVYRMVAELAEVFNAAIGVAYPKFSLYAVGR